MMVETNSNFDELAANYDEYRVGYSKQLYDYLEGELGFAPAWHVLDVGCGTAIASAPFAAKGYEVTGVDPSEAMLARARIRVPSGRFVQGRAEALPFADGEF
ncbi:MAG: class I SAM-dependent methyltransferase, partial [Candidatus Eremiobacteraeota bacterium]|nr:class I SAM-dependent methyltransferase [Candidatus Eremiobacteraeota bacterium]